MLNTTIRHVLSLWRDKDSTAVAARSARWLRLIVLLGLILRLGYALAQPTLPEYTGAGGGDSAWYLANGWGFFSGQEHGRIRGIPFYNSSANTPPLYILYAGIFQTILPEHEAILLIRILQCLAATATIYCVFRLGALIAGDQRAGLIGAVLTALHPALVIEPANIATETLYIFFIACGLWIYTEYSVDAASRRSPGRLSPSAGLALAGLAFGLATLTRAVSLLFPAGIALHLLLLQRRRLTRSWLRQSGLLLLAYIAMLSTWTIHNGILWNRLTFVSDQFLPALWRGAETEDGSPRQNDALLLDGNEAPVADGCEIDCKYRHGSDLYVEKIGGIVGADPTGYFRIRLNELLYALVQPHGTIAFGDVSIREAAHAWIIDDRSVNGLVELLRIGGFLPKLTIWIFHAGGIALGLLGIYWSRHRWPLTLPLIGFILYTITTHLFLLALPRYLFPLECIWLIFASAAIHLLIEGRQQRQAKADA